MRLVVIAIDSGGIIFSFPFICFDFFKDILLLSVILHYSYFYM